MQVITNGTYNVSANVPGYENATITPTSQIIEDAEGSYTFTIAATGTLTLHVSDDGTEAGTPIVGATLVRCDSVGNVYGDPITSDDSGNAVFENVPFSEEGDAPVIYYKQTASDTEHNFEVELYNTTLDSDTKTVEIFNEPAVQKEIKLTDQNYSGLPIEQGEIEVTESTEMI